MVQLDLVEKYRLAGLRMFDYRRRKLPNSQTIVRRPFEINRRAAAVVFDCGPFRRLKKTLPTNVQSFREVAHVHQAVALKTLTNARLHLTIDRKSTRLNS